MNMFRALLPSLTIALVAMATAQTNLVHNGSFEDTALCAMPTQCTLLKAEGWNNPNMNTPDVWDTDLDRSCGYPMDPDAPETIGYRSPVDGTRFAGAFFWTGPGSGGSEYLMSRLSDPLVSGQQYEVSLYCSRVSAFRYAIDHIGMYFGSDSVYESTFDGLDLTPQIKLRDAELTYLTESLNWQRLVDTLTANGGEEWMLIGNFDPAELVDGIEVTTSQFPYAYYFLDSVSVTPLLTNSVRGVYPSVWFTGQGLCLDWEVRGGIKCAVTDMLGKVLYTTVAYKEDRRWNWSLPRLSEGVYVFTFDQEGQRFTTKVAMVDGVF